MHLQSAGRDWMKILAVARPVIGFPGCGGLQPSPNDMTLDFTGSGNDEAADLKRLMRIVARKHEGDIKGRADLPGAPPAPNDEPRHAHESDQNDIERNPQGVMVTNDVRRANGRAIRGGHEEDFAIARAG